MSVVRLVAGWLVEDTGEHTCNGGTMDVGYAHEHHCGLLPLFDADQIGEQPFDTLSAMYDADPAAAALIEAEVARRQGGAR